MIHRMLPCRRPLRRAGALAAAGLAALATLAGCASGAGSGGGDLTIGVTLNAASNPFFLAEGRAIEQAAGPGVRVAVQYANADVATQSNQIDTFIRQRVDSIVVDAVDSDGIGPAVLRAKQAGIPVVAIDVTATGANATVASDNVQAGRDACAYLAEQLGGRAKIAIVDGSAVSAIADRMSGCRQALAQVPGIEVVATQRADLTRDKSMTVASNILTAHPDVAGFFGVNDPTAIGIALAAQQKGARVKVVGVDGARQLTDLFGEGLIIGTSGQDPAKLGRTGLDLATRVARKEQVPSAPVLIPTVLVTPQTLDAYPSWG
ncbi:substrate-binding domain-containing protein [Amycolatopsis sacchari]|uniref:substrate-binding domain-containing protein n=2 Tax=Amycolatopsis sacchari TaxID=115433 RepID=UPI003D70682D